jgi:hypothetical protein
MIQMHPTLYAWNLESDGPSFVRRLASRSSVLCTILSLQRRHTATLLPYDTRSTLQYKYYYSNAARVHHSTMTTHHSLLVLSHLTSLSPLSTKHYTIQSVFFSTHTNDKQRWTPVTLMT